METVIYIEGSGKRRKYFIARIILDKLRVEVTELSEPTAIQIAKAVPYPEFQNNLIPALCGLEYWGAEARALRWSFKEALLQIVLKHLMGK